MKLTRDFYIPKNAEKVQENNLLTIYHFDFNDKVGAIAFKPRAQKPFFYYTFPTEERRKTYEEEINAQLAKREESKQERRQARKEFKTSLQIGDILDSSWGYEQTNIDFYQVTDVKGNFVTIRPIAQTREYHGQDYGTCAPVKDSFIGEPIRKMATMGYKNGDSYSGDYIKLTSYSSASTWDGKPRNWSSWY